MNVGQSVQSVDDTGSTDAFSIAIQFFDNQLDNNISRVAAVPIETPRKYFTEVRGWSEETVNRLKLGYAPKSERLKQYLRDLGYSDEELLATGLFTEFDDGRLSCLFKGRYVFPYYDKDGKPVYAIARKTGDYSTLNGKYVKCSTSGNSEIQEPIFGIHAFDPDKGCWIVEGMADAITALEHEMPVLSPVTTQFKRGDRERLLEILEAHDIEKVMVVADNDEAGLQGAVSTAAFLSENGFDAHVTAPPEDGDDLDGYVDSRDDFNELVDRKTPVEEHELYDEVTTDFEEGQTNTERDFDGGFSDLTIPDVEPSLSAGYRGKNPLSHSGSRTDYFVVSKNGRLAYDHKKKVGYNPKTYLLCDIGKRSADDPNGELSDEEIRAVRKEASNRGLISDGEYPADGSEQSISLPKVASDHDSAEWDWRAASIDDEGALTLDKARQRCQQHIDDALRNGEHTLIDALPAMGKSSGVVRGAAKTDTRITVFTARHELYGQYKKWCDEHNLSCYQLPSFHKDCPTADGKHGEDWQEKVRSLYDNGVMPGEIHKYVEQHFGEPLPCDDGQECPYKQGWDFELDEYEVLIGHYQHAYNPNITAERVAVFDEFPADALLVEFDGDTVPSAVSAYLSMEDGLPFEDHTELIEERNSDRGDEARDWFDADDLERDGEPVLMDENEAAHAFAPLLTYAVLCGEDLGNGWEYTDLDPKSGLGNHRRAARNRDSSEVTLLLPPETRRSNGVIALDGTPTTDLWQLTVDTRLSRRKILSDEEQADYLTDALDHSIVQTAGDSAYSYSGGNAVKPERDELLFKSVAEREGRDPALISTRKALKQYEQAGALKPVGKDEYYGNLKGSNQFENEYVGIVAGSTHYGDEHVKMWGALAGKSVERVGDGRGMSLDYGEFGNAVLQHMREHEVLQAVLRFGRNDKPTTVYVHTAALPEWVPVKAKSEIQRWSKGTREVVEALEADAPDEWKTADITEDVSIGTRQVRNVLNELVEDGYIEKGTDGRATLWQVEAEELDRLGRVTFRSS